MSIFKNVFNNFKIFLKKLFENCLKKFFPFFKNSDADGNANATADGQLGSLTLSVAKKNCISRAVLGGGLVAEWAGGRIVPAHLVLHLKMKKK